MTKGIKIAAAFCAASALGIGGYQTYVSAENPVVEHARIASPVRLSVSEEDNAQMQACLGKIEREEGCSATEVRKLVALRTNEKNASMGLSLMLAGGLGLSFLGATLGTGKKKEEKPDQDNTPDVPINPGMTM